MIISDANLSDDKNITEQSKNQEQKLGYVYRHIRLDTNMPFYIGIGTMDKGKYDRAYEIKNSRSDEWKEVVDNTEYRVEILLKEVPVSIIGDKEKYFIKLYGRVDKGTGTLVNKTNGGKGTCGAVISDETRRKKSELGKCRKNTKETRKKISDANKGNTNWLGKPHTAESKKKISDFHKGNKYWEGKKHTEETKKKISDTRERKPVGQYKDGILLKEYPSVISTKLDGYLPIKVSSCCRGKQKTHKGYEWKFI